MKKQLSLAALAVLGLTTAIASASPSDLSIENVFKGEFDYGYTLNQNISLKGFQSDEAQTGKHLELTSPLLKDAKDQLVGEYVLVVGDKDLSTYTTGADIHTEKFAFKSFFPTEEDKMMGELKVKIMPEDVNKDVNQFAFLVPLNDNYFEGKPSKQFCFNFADGKYQEGEACANFGNEVYTAVDSAVDSEEHNAAGADMSLAGISHTVKGNVITLTWLKQLASENLEIKLFDKETADFKTLTTVPMASEMFEYIADPGIQEYIFAFIPRDAKGKEVRYDLNVRTETDVKPDVKPVKVGPVEDMMLMIAITVALYAGYRVFAARKV